MKLQLLLIPVLLFSACGKPSETVSAETISPSEKIVDQRQTCHTFMDCVIDGNKNILSRLITPDNINANGKNSAFAKPENAAKSVELKNGEVLKWVQAGAPALSIAALLGNTEMAKMLIEKGGDVNFAADMNILKNQGTTPIFAAVSSGNPETVKLLLDNGAELIQSDIKMIEDCSIHHMFHTEETYSFDVFDFAAATANKKVIEVILDRISEDNKNLADNLFLITKGEEINMSLLSAAKQALEKKRRDIAEFLISKGVFLRKVWFINEDAQITAIMEKQRSNTGKLKKYGKDILLTIAAHNDGGAGGEYDLEDALYLIQNGVDVNVKNSYGKTPLILSALKRRKDMIKLLLENGADVNAQENDCKTALDILEEKINNKKDDMAIWSKGSPTEQEICTLADLIRAKGGKTCSELTSRHH